jgi:hypothetical protein
LWRETPVTQSEIAERIEDRASNILWVLLKSAHAARGIRGQEKIKTRSGNARLRPAIKSDRG